MTGCISKEQMDTIEEEQKKMNEEIKNEKLLEKLIELGSDENVKVRGAQGSLSAAHKDR